jgi:ABC-type nitrate/sulfonate/bicarbonate transport system ATPase subunit
MNITTDDTSYLKFKIRTLEDDNERRKHIIQEQDKALLHWRRAYDDVVAQLKNASRPYIT